MSPRQIAEYNAAYNEAKRLMMAVKNAQGRYDFQLAHDLCEKASIELSSINPAIKEKLVDEW